MHYSSIVQYAYRYIMNASTCKYTVHIYFVIVMSNFDAIIIIYPYKCNLCFIEIPQPLSYELVLKTKKYP